MSLFLTSDNPQRHHRLPARTPIGAAPDQVDRRRRPLVEPLRDVEDALAAVREILPSVPKRLRPQVKDALTTLAAKTPVRRRRRRKASADTDQTTEAALQAPDTDAVEPAAAEAVEAEAEGENPICPEYVGHYWSSDITVIALGRPYTSSPSWTSSPATSSPGTSS